MRRKLFNFAAAVSLMLCVAAGAIWVRSYRPRPQARMVSFDGARGRVFRAVPLFARPERSAFVGSARGRLLLVQQSAATHAGAVDASHCGVFGSPGSVVVYSPPHVVQGTGFLGFGRASQAFPWGGAASVFAIPLWAVVAVTLALPLSALRRRLRDSQWSRQGRCRNCGYDLRASPDRCPECGAAPMGAAQAAA